MNTIKDVASRAGVSVSTVSNVLNGRTERMAKDTLARIESVIVELRFRPNAVARHLKTGQASLLGLLVPSLANPIYGTIAKEIEAHAQARFGHRVLIGSTYRDRKKESAFFDDLLTHGVRQVIVISSLTDESHFETAVERGMTVVSYDRRAASGRPSRVMHVTPDNFEAARIATEHLIAHGHRRLGFATMGSVTMSRSAKIQGFQAAASRAGLLASATVLSEAQLVGYGDATTSETGRALGLRLAADDARPTGIVAVNDLVALGMMAGLRKAGLRVPDDVSIVGIEDLFLASLSNPGLSTVQLPIAEMARTMVDLALTPGVQGNASAREEVFERAVLVERESVGPPPGSQAARRAA